MRPLRRRSSDILSGKAEAWPDEAAMDFELDYDLVMKSIESCAALKPGFLSVDNA
jgi:hypothetical protein